VPEPMELVLGVLDWLADSSSMMPSTLLTPCWRRSSTFTTVIGSAPSSVMERRMAEPVISTRSRVCCAKAGWIAAARVASAAALTA